MRIGELAARSGVSERSLRYYEEQGLVLAARGPNGYRDFAEHDVARIAHIQVLFAAGLCSSKIAELLPCISGTEDSIEPAPDLVHELEIAHDRIKRQIADLSASLEVLDSVLAASRSGSSAQTLDARSTRSR